MTHHAHARQQRQQPGDRHAEAVKGRQEAEDGVLARHLQDVDAAALVAEEVAVRQRHRLGRLLRAAGEQHHGRAVRVRTAERCSRTRPGNQRTFSSVGSSSTLPICLRRSSRKT